MTCERVLRGLLRLVERVGNKRSWLAPSHAQRVLLGCECASEKEADERERMFERHSSISKQLYTTNGPSGICGELSGGSCCTWALRHNSPRQAPRPRRFTHVTAMAAETRHLAAQGVLARGSDLRGRSGQTAGRAEPSFGITAAASAGRSGQSHRTQTFVGTVSTIISPSAAALSSPSAPRFNLASAPSNLRDEVDLCSRAVCPLHCPW